MCAAYVVTRIQEEKAKNPNQGNVILGNAAALAGLKLHIGNLHQNITEDDLGEICRSFGEVMLSMVIIRCFYYFYCFCCCCSTLSPLPLSIVRVFFFF